MTVSDASRERRLKRDRRRSDGLSITGRDEAVTWVSNQVAKDLLSMDEVQERLMRAAKARALILARYDQLPQRWTLIAAARYNTALERLAADFDGALRDAATIRHWVADWPRTLARIRMGWPPVAIASWTGRPGRERTMTTASIYLAARSLALRPQAREQLNSESATSEGQGAGPQPHAVHRHSQTTRARGAARADELAAREASEKGFMVNQQMVFKARRSLRRVLDEL